MIQTYLEYLYAGIIVSETSSERVTDRTFPKELPSGCFGFRFYDVKEEEVDGEILVGKPTNYSHWYYEKGDVLTVADVKRLHPDKRILISNMENNNILRVLMTKYGQAIPLNENDIILD